MNEILGRGLFIGKTEHQRRGRRTIVRVYVRDHSMNSLKVDSRFGVTRNYENANEKHI